MTVGVVGLGLIGGSIGLALRDPDREIVGFDPLESHAKMALERSCVDRLEPLEQVAQADVVFVAAPPAKVVEVLDALWAVRRETTIITDCTSAKAFVAEWAMRVGDPLFVPGHPMAGHEKSGPGFASAWMFRNASWILSPLAITSPAAIETVEGLVKAMGATPVRIPAELHDRHVAIVSHLPHALAGLLVLLSESTEGGALAGGSWRDLTRVAGVDPGLWTQIFLANGVELGKVLNEMSSKLAELGAWVKEGDEQAVRGFFTSALAAKSAQAPSAPAGSRGTGSGVPRAKRRR